MLKQATALLVMSLPQSRGGDAGTQAVDVTQTGQ